MTSEGEPAEFPRDRLLRGIGSVCEAHVQLDLRLGLLYTVLFAPSDPQRAFNAPQGTAARIDRCRKRLSGSGLPDDLRAAGDLALEDAQQANELRNRVVHDWWIERMDDPQGNPYTRMRSAKGVPGLIAEPSDVAFVDNALEQVRRAYARISALGLAVVHAMAGMAGPPLPDGFGYEELLPEIRGEFDLNPDGSWVPRQP